jgi:hypothetical protein
MHAQTANMQVVNLDDKQSSTRHVFDFMDDRRNFMYNIHSQIDPENVTSRMDIVHPCFGNPHCRKHPGPIGEGLNKHDILDQKTQTKGSDEFEKQEHLSKDELWAQLESKKEAACNNLHWGQDNAAASKLMRQRMTRRASRPSKYGGRSPTRPSQSKQKIKRPAARMWQGNMELASGDGYGEAMMGTFFTWPSAKSALRMGQSSKRLAGCNGPGKKMMPEPLVMLSQADAKIDQAILETYQEALILKDHDELDREYKEGAELIGRVYLFSPELSMPFGFKCIVREPKEQRRGTKNVTQMPDWSEIFENYDTPFGYGRDLTGVGGTQANGEQNKDSVVARRPRTHD